MRINKGQVFFTDCPNISCEASLTTLKLLSQFRRQFLFDVPKRNAAIFGAFKFSFFSPEAEISLLVAPREFLTVINGLPTEHTSGVTVINGLLKRPARSDQLIDRPVSPFSPLESSYLSLDDNSRWGIYRDFLFPYNLKQKELQNCFKSIRKVSTKQILESWKLAKLSI